MQELNANKIGEKYLDFLDLVGTQGDFSFVQQISQLFSEPCNKIEMAKPKKFSNNDMQCCFIETKEEYKTWNISERKVTRMNETNEDGNTSVLVSYVVLAEKIKIIVEEILQIDIKGKIQKVYRTKKRELITN